MARPKKITTDRRSHVLGIRLKTSEIEQLKTQCIDAGLPMQSLARRKLLLRHGELEDINVKELFLSIDAQMLLVNQLEVSISTLASVISSNDEIETTDVSSEVAVLLEKSIACRKDITLLHQKLLRGITSLLAVS